MKRIYAYHELGRLIPERPPLLMVDRIELDLDARRAVAAKTLSMNEAFFQGHFPGAPIMPGVLQVAAMAQAGGAILKQALSAADARIPWCLGLNRVKFRSPVYPGDRLVVTAEIKGQTSEGWTEVEAKAQVGDTVTSTGGILLALAEPGDLTPPPAALAPSLFVPPGCAHAVPVNTQGIMKAIPHRFPFLLIDRLYRLSDPSQRCIGLKNVTGNEPFFAGTGAAAMPGWLQVETAAQVCCTLALEDPANVGKLAFFMSIDEARFPAPVVPGDQLLLDMQVNSRGRFGRAEGSLYVADRVVTTAALKFAIVDSTNGGTAGPTPA